MVIHENEKTPFAIIMVLLGAVALAVPSVVAVMMYDSFGWLGVAGVGIATLAFVGAVVIVRARL